MKLFGLYTLLGISISASNVLSSPLFVNQLEIRQDPTANVSNSADISNCPGYKVSQVDEQDNGLTATLTLSGDACNAYGSDIQNLKLTVEYEEEERLHVKIIDADNDRYEVPESVVQRSESKQISKSNAKLQFEYTKEPFSFKVKRTDSGQEIFSTSGPIVFEPQYWRLATEIGQDANIYGLGEHSDSFKLKTKDYTRTMWNRDANFLPENSNLYSAHPIYLQHDKQGGSHGVFLMNSNGMDVKFNDNLLEYNVIGGIIDFYFFAGPKPADISKQYSKVVGLPAEFPYWGYGFHQCKYGYTDYQQLADVRTNYSNAGIPLETLWSDIDYMYKRRVFTVDPEYYPLDKMREIVQYLHEHDQHFVMMVDPAVAYNESDGAFQRGVEKDVFLKESNGSLFLSVVWPGVTVYPDWFHPNIQEYWDNEFLKFFDPDTGIDIDALWIDMNEPSNFCHWPCDDPFAWAEESGNPPNRTTEPPPPRDPFPQALIEKREANVELDYNYPPYKIDNYFNVLGNRTSRPDLLHHGDILDYDSHNLYGSMMSITSANAMKARRPDKRPLVITRSTFAGAGRSVGKWTGDNISNWGHYRLSINSHMQFASIYSVPMVGSDICGFNENVTETLCARWAQLGSFAPFMRNHNVLEGNPQEFYRWESVAKSARKAIDRRYQLLDYFYTNMHKSHIDGSPSLNPLFFIYPEDENTFDIDLQFFYGDSILVSPVTEENSTSVEFYVPNDVFYEYDTLETLEGEGKNITLNDLDLNWIGVHIKGGSILPLRMTDKGEPVMTTTELRKRPFRILVAPDREGKAKGTLYLDEGDGYAEGSMVNFSYDGSELTVWTEGGDTSVAASSKIEEVVFLATEQGTVRVPVDKTLADEFTLSWKQ